MFDQINSFFKKIFSNQETIIFSFIILTAFLMMSFFGSVLTPFMISIVVAYLLVGLQKKIESWNVRSSVALVITFSIFIITGAAMLVWLLPILYIQLQAFVLDIPDLFNSFLEFVSTLPAKFPDLISSDQITAFFQSVTSDLASLTQNVVKSSIAGIQSTITILLYIILCPILVFFFLFDRKNILDGLSITTTGTVTKKAPT